MMKEGLNGETISLYKFKNFRDFSLILFFQNHHKIVRLWGQTMTIIQMIRQCDLMRFKMQKLFLIINKQL